MPSPPELVAQFTAVTDDLMAGAPDAARRKMFGYPACFAGGHLVTSLHEDRWIVRLSAPDIAELGDIGGTPFEPMAGRPMRGFMVLPEEVRSDRARLDEWLARALAHVRGMPPK
ncbi:MAG: TfoX/Sxy family protein [Chloroflexota bacterium]